jgi:DNA helicase II / ATP-dependent DNA helicase PcrA
MDKRVIFAVAGSGKTTRIVEELGCGDRRCLVITYTEENARNLRGKILDRYGVMPPGVSVQTYFAFLYSFCYRPVEGLRSTSRGLSLSEPPEAGRFSQQQDGYFRDKAGRPYYGRLAKLLIVRQMVQEVRERIEKFYDLVCVDEVQDFAGNDFNLLIELTAVKASMLLVGDFWQHTYDTSRDGVVNKNLHKDFDTYAKRFRKAGVEVDTGSLSRSRRCSRAVCDFISARLGIPIETLSEYPAEVKLVEDPAVVDALWRRDEVVKLFWSEHARYGCRSQNWGASKGEDHYNEVCVILTGTVLQAYKKNTLAQMTAEPRNKLYVALSRSRGNVFLIPPELAKSYRT